MDDTTFLTELKKVENKLSSLALSLTKGNIDDAQELLQATVVRAYEKREYFTIGTRFDLWIETIMKNAHLNNVLSAKRRSVKITVDYTSFSSSNGLYNIDKQLEYSEVCSLIKTLPREISVPLMLYARGYKYDEIACMQHLPMSTVKNRIRAARIYLKRMIKE